MENDKIKELNNKIKNLVTNHWLHNFNISDDGELILQDSTSWCASCWKYAFGSLLKDKTILDIEEISGLYSILMAKVNPQHITISQSDTKYCELIDLLTQAFDIKADIINQKMIICQDGSIFVDKNYIEKFNYVFALNYLWSLYALCRDFDDIIEALSHYVTDGILMDWNEAKWANPPKEYTLENFLIALRKKFKYVIHITGDIVIAIEKIK
jgi:hypothetical protein